MLFVVYDSCFFGGVGMAWFPQCNVLCPDCRPNLPRDDKPWALVLTKQLKIEYLVHTVIAVNCNPNAVMAFLHTRS